MKLQQRSFSSQNFRPRPALHLEADGSFLVVATSWGDPETAEKIVEDVSKYVNAARGDVEVTSPFQYLTCYTNEENFLRISALLANEALFRRSNAKEYVDLVELLVLHRKGRQLSWVQCGSPQLFLKSKTNPLAPLAVNRDQSMDRFGSSRQSAPMPGMALGLESHCHLNVGNCLIHSQDQLLLLASPELPSQLWEDSQDLLQMKTLSEKLSPMSDRHPLWCALVDLE